MKSITVVTTYSSTPGFESTLAKIAESNLVKQINVVSHEPVSLGVNKCRVMASGPLVSGETLRLILDGLQTAHLLLLPGERPISIQPVAIERMLLTAESADAAMVYADFYDASPHGELYHPLNDYQQGSVRDDFDFGGAMLFSVAAIRRAVTRYGTIPDVRFAGLYDLRLKLSIDSRLHHCGEPVYAALDESGRSGGEKLFAYIDPRNASVQREMEAVFTEYLKNINAYLPHERLRQVEPQNEAFPVEASVVIPVLNRVRTISDAVRSALSQETTFPFNVIVVDNHSTDGTTTLLSTMARSSAQLRHIVPARTDLGIGGCWNEAVHSDACGRYAVQLDSDDLYRDARVLQTVVDTLGRGRYAMVVGSYTLVNERLEEIPPGLVDHREWTDENGHNNALRVNGMGAPRAFQTSVVRKIGFPNVSYGEDYAVALRVCREYRIGRVFESLYLCRRWQGNTDAALTIEQANRNDAFKDTVRTQEIIARRKMNQALGAGSGGRQ